MHHNRQAWAGVESPLKPTISVNVDDFETDEYIDDELSGEARAARLPTTNELDQLMGALGLIALKPGQFIRFLFLFCPPISYATTPDTRDVKSNRMMRTPVMFWDDWCAAAT